MTSEIAEVLGIRPLAPGIDCHSWCPVWLGEAELDFCAIDGLPAAEHPADAFDTDEEVEA